MGKKKKERNEVGHLLNTWITHRLRFPGTSFGTERRKASARLLCVFLLLAPVVKLYIRAGTYRKREG
jgi:hypothetical protein